MSSIYTSGRRQARSILTMGLILGVSLLNCGCLTMPPTRAVGELKNQVNDRLAQPSAWRPELTLGLAGNTPEITALIQQLLEHELTPDRAVEIGLINNAGWRASLQDLGVTQADLMTARTIENPHLEFMARVVDDHDAHTNVEFTIVQDLMSLVTRTNRVRISQYEMERVKNKLTEEVLSLAANIRKATYAAVAAVKKQVLYQELYTSSQHAAEMATRQFQAGNINELELAWQQLTYQTTKLKLADMELEVFASRQALNRLLGIVAAQSAWTIMSELPELPPAPAADNLEERVLTANLTRARLGVEKSMLMEHIHLTKKERLDTLELGFNTEKEPEGEQLSGGLIEVGLPVFDRKQGELQKWNALMVQKENQVNAHAVEIQTRARELEQRLQAARAKVEYYQEAILPLQKRIMALSQLHYNAMFIGVYELLQARDDEVMAQIDFIDACRDFWILQTDWELALAGVVISPEYHPSTAPRDQGRAAQSH